jgi:hypothetical protein
MQDFVSIWRLTASLSIRPLCPTWLWHPMDKKMGATHSQYGPIKQPKSAPAVKLTDFQVVQHLS